MFKLLKKFWPVVMIFIITCLIFLKIITRGQYPIPADLLVSFYYPFYSGGWDGYDPWTTRKEMLGADSIRQIYLWKEFAAGEFKKGQLPLWNPYTFSGQPLLANFQSSVFYPLNIFYFITGSRNAWILLIVTQPLLGGLFMYLATRSFKAKKVSSLFSATAFMFSSYLITWMENGNISHSYIWLPLGIWAINNYFENSQNRYLIILISSLALTIFAGHPQTAIYIYITTFIFWLFKVAHRKTQKTQKVIVLIISFISTLLLSAIQIAPTVSFYKISPISLPFSREVFDKSILPYKNLITFFASDFYGHPANNNFWSQSYGDFTPYFGVLPLMFSLWAIFKLWRYSFVKFATITAAIFIIATVNGPITYLIKVFQVPLLNSTTPSRFISISIFFLILISAFGFDDILKNLNSAKYKKQFIFFLAPFFLLYSTLFLFSLMGANFLQPKEQWLINLTVTKRNLILPITMFLTLPISFGLLTVCTRYLGIKEYTIKKLFVLGIFTTTIIGGVYYSNKFLPQAPLNFIFPSHPLFSWLKENAGINRSYGGGTAHVDYNFPTHYEVFGAEGYDTLRLKRYAELLASAQSGQVPEKYLRSDAVFPSEENGYRSRLLELTGVKYLLDKEDNPKNGNNWHESKFSPDEVKGIWQFQKFQVYERKNVLPRVFLTTDYKVAINDREIISNIYDQNYPLTKVIIEREPREKIIYNGQILLPTIKKYEPQDIVLETNTESSSILFLSDAYEPGWKATIDSKPTEVLRAHYAFRAVEVPAGKHFVTFKYTSQSAQLGLYVTYASIALLLLFSIVSLKSKTF